MVLNPLNSGNLEQLTLKGLSGRSLVRSSLWSACADGPEENSSKLLSMPFVEDPQQRLKWTAYLEFTHNNEVGDLTWDKVSIHSRLLLCLIPSNCQLSFTWFT